MSDISVELEVTEQVVDEPIAKIQGQPFLELPTDLYIPPEALLVFLEAFEGPLDLLLYLIKKQNIDILDIPLAEITRQYVEYVELMKELRLELAAEYLVMAAMLAEIKSRMLLPRTSTEEEEETDPRSELIRRLQEYERYKQAAENLDTLPRCEREIFTIAPEIPDLKITRPLPQVELRELIMVFQTVLKRAELNAEHHIKREVLSIRERMTIILTKLRECEFAPFESLFTVEEGRMGVVVSFIAILELVKQTMIEIIQTEPFTPIHVRGV